MERKQDYKIYITKCNEALQQQKKISIRYLGAKLVAFILALFGFYYAYHEANYYILSGALFLFGIYLFLYKKDILHQYQMDWMRKRIQVLQNELSYLKGNYTSFRDGTQYMNPNHSFSYDLDLFGPSSFFHRINRTLTLQGQDELAQCMQQLPSSPDVYSSLLARQRAIEELSALPEWRTDFLSLPFKGDLPLSRIRLENIKESWSFRFLLTASFTRLHGFSLLLLLGLIIGSVVLDWSSSLPTFYFFFQLLLATLAHRRIMKVMKNIGDIHADLKNYTAILKQISTIQFKTPLNQAIHQDLVGKEKSALIAIKTLNRLTEQLDRRGNILLLVVCNGLFLQDFLLLRKTEIWKRKYTEVLQEAMNRIGELDALVSMATYAYNTPYAICPIVQPTTQFVYKATALYHPFLQQEDAVVNDFQMDETHFYIVTGANMAGKSTFLRSVGLNYVLALIGLPVCADCLEISFFHLFTSMRTSDNLSKNISYFNAELLRLKQLITATKKQEHTLIILDEILKGTNSEDKLKGSRLFLEFMMKQAVTGIVATHDLKLSTLEQIYHCFHNYCFEIDLSQLIRYSYKMTPGVAKNMNATYLLENILKEE